MNNSPKSSPTVHTVPNMQKFLYSRREAAQCLGLSVRSVDYLIEAGTLKCRRIGGRVLIHVKTLEIFATSDHTPHIVRS